MYLNEQIPMVCLGCLENKYFPRDLIFGAGKNATEPSGMYICSCVHRTCIKVCTHVVYHPKTVVYVQYERVVHIYLYTHNVHY